MVNKTLISIIFAGSLAINPSFGEEKNISNNEIQKIIKLDNTDYKALKEKHGLNISQNPDYGTKVYTTKSGGEKPEFYAIKTNRKVQLYYPAKN